MRHLVVIISVLTNMAVLCNWVEAQDRRPLVIWHTENDPATHERFRALGKEFRAKTLIVLFSATPCRFGEDQGDPSGQGAAVFIKNLYMRTPGSAGRPGKTRIGPGACQ